MKLYGTTTSPFVRRVHVVAEELGEPIERVDTATDAGMAELKTVSPIWKVPVAIVEEGQTLLDSHSIHRYLVGKYGSFGTHSPHEANLITAIDAAIDSVIQLFYLKRDKVDATGSVFEKRQLERTQSIFDWLATQQAEGTFSGGFGLAELSLISALDWMEFRNAYPVTRAAALGPVRARWRDRPSLVSTRPRT